MQVKIESANDFFARGRVTAFLADKELASLSANYLNLASTTHF
jgi:hypothetical protein